MDLAQIEAVRVFRLEFFLSFLIFLGLGSTVLYGAQSRPEVQKVELPQHKFGCEFVCLKLVRSGTYGALYEGHETFRLFLVGNVYEDNFEQRVLNKANISCKGGNTVKLIDFKTNTFAMSDGLGNTQKLTKVTNARVFSPVKHCKVEPSKKK